MMLEERGMSKHPVGCRGLEHKSRTPVKKASAQGGGSVLFLGGTLSSGSPQHGRAIAVGGKGGTHSPRMQVRILCSMERSHGGSSPSRAARGHTWLHGHRWAAPTHLPLKKIRLRNPPNCSFLVARRRLGSSEQPAWARRESRIPVLGHVSCADTSEQRLLPTGVMEAANNPGMPRLCAAQLSASCPFLGGCSATGRVHLLAIIQKRNCADRSS